MPNKKYFSQTKSNRLPINKVVPQAFVLGPDLLIQLLTNDLPQYLSRHCTLLMYADGTTLFVSRTSLDDLAVDSYIFALNMANEYFRLMNVIMEITLQSRLIKPNTCFWRRQKKTCPWRHRPNFWSE